MFNQEKIIETKVCKHCNSSFDITDKDLEFYQKVSPVFTRPLLTPPYQGGEQTLPLTKGELEGVLDLGNGKIKYIIPSPTLCPDCRQQRRLSFRNERKLYKRKCDATGENIISIYSPDKPYKVYNGDFWWSDKWDGLDYGKDFDFSKTFFEQFTELMKEVPRINILNGYNENCEYTNHGWKSKNCYLCVGFGNIENCYYSSNIENCTNCIDCNSIFNCENCYGCLNLNKSFNCNYSYFSENISNSLLLYECNNCEYCIGCTNLKNKKYCIFNEQKSKEEYDYFMLKLDYDFISRKFTELYGKTINKNLRNINIESSNGDLLENCKDCKESYECQNCENIKFGYELRSSKYCYDMFVWGENPECCYEGHCVTGNNILFSNVIWGGNNLTYCDNILSSNSNLFGCIGLRNKSYCILNKQYEKSEYENLVPKIIEHMQRTGEWGEFFPSSISPFGYNETVAQEYFPITPPSIPPLTGDGSKIFNFSLSPIRGKMSEGQIGVFNRSTYEPPFPKVDKIIKVSMLPENISDIPDDILNWAIECEVSGKPFRIIKAELDFYRKHNLPIPKRHPDIRHLDRLALRNPRKLFDRKCDKCGKDIKTTYSPDRKEIVYCESCYEKEVY